MNRVFVDTGALIALADRRDQHHRSAAAFFKLRASSTRWFTSDFVLDETATRLRAALGAEAAVAFVRAIRASSLYDVLPVGNEIFEAGLGWMLKYQDQALSFTDCTSFALMDGLKLRDAFGFDSDFTRCGYTLLP